MNDLLRSFIKNKFKLNDMVRRSRHHSHRRSSNTSHHYSRQKYYQTYMAKIIGFVFAIILFFALTFGRIIPAFLGMIVLIFLFIAALIILRGTLTKIICIIGLIFSAMILFAEIYPAYALPIAALIVFGSIAAVILGLRLIWILIVAGVAGLGAGFGFEYGRSTARRRFR